jgi:hypothetical protein
VAHTRQHDPKLSTEAPYSLYVSYPVYALRWHAVADHAIFEQRMADLERHRAAYGEPLVLIAVFPHGLGVPAPSVARHKVASMHRFEQATRMNILILEGRGPLTRANLVVLQAMALASGRSNWVYFRNSAREALRDFPPPDLGVDAEALMHELLAHRICLR